MKNSNFEIAEGFGVSISSAGWENMAQKYVNFEFIEDFKRSERNKII